MKIKKIRKLNLFWGALSILISIGLTFGAWFLLKNKPEYIWDFIICWFCNFGIFWGFYLIRFCFKKTKYSFVLSEPNEYVGWFGQWISDKSIFWLLIFPLLAAICVPIFYYVSVVITNNNEIVLRTLIVGITIIISLLNNIGYLYTIRKISEKERKLF